MDEWNFEKLKNALEPLGFYVEEHAWVGDEKPRSWLFKLSKSVLLEFFIVLDMNTGEMGCGDTFSSWGRGKSARCNIKDVNFDIIEYARNYVRTYKLYNAKKAKQDLENDFN